ncbi:MAG: hypothetical protein FWC27_05680 [Firmicutes bacterium]|nr:hypothetical protein [Bacillota bacterium]
MLGTIFFPLSRVVTAVIVFFTSIFSGAGPAAAMGRADPGLDPLPYPKWTHEHMVWEHHGTQASTVEFVEGFTSRGIPVGIVDIEPPWATAKNTYQPDKALYPDMRGLVNWCHRRGMKLILWTTCMLNEDAPTFEEAKAKGYLVSKGKTQEWWSGVGAFLDYSNPEAVAWWHRQMDIVLDMGADGWKVDGAEPYLALQIPSWGKQGPLSWQRYKKMVYDDFYHYTKEKTKGRGVAWARPTDDVVAWGLPITFMDRDINFMGWVGDQDNDWGGLRGALNNMFTSAMLNYVSFGSDIGGFRSSPAKPDPEDVFLRWAQLGAFCTVMENGGGGEHRPWKYDERRGDGKTYVTDIYRKFTRLHYELIPYISSQVAWSYERRQPTMRPTAGYYQYMLGGDIFVAPIVKEGDERGIVFPEGEWIYLFDETKSYKGVKKLSFPLDEFPAFIRRGAIFPMEGTGDAFTTVRVYPAKGTQEFGLYEQDARGTMLSYTKTNSGLTLKSGKTGRQLMFRVYGEPAPASVKLGGAALKQASSMKALKGMAPGYYTRGNITWIFVKDAKAGAEIHVNYQ